MPQDIVVRESRGLNVLLALFSVLALAALMPTSFERLTDGSWSGMDILLGSFTAMFIFGAPLLLKSAWHRKVVLVAFHQGLFCPSIHPDVIPWNGVESVRLNHILHGTRVQIVFSSEIRAKLRMNWLVRCLVMATTFAEGWYFSGLNDHRNEAVVHVIDDWIRYETRQAPKPRYRPGMTDAVLRHLA